MNEGDALQASSGVGGNRDVNLQPSILDPGQISIMSIGVNDEEELEQLLNRSNDDLQVSLKITQSIYSSKP